MEIKQLLPALNNHAKKAEAKQWPIDRHVAAFITARFGHDVDKYIVQLNDPSEEKSAMGMLNLLALLQHRLGPESLPNLASWVGGLVQPAINTYHSKDRRKELEQEIPKLVRRGSLVALYKLLDDAEARQKDSDGFGWAIADYVAADREIGMLEMGGEHREARANRLGQQTAATISVVISLFTITVLVIMKVW